MPSSSGSKNALPRFPVAGVSETGSASFCEIALPHSGQNFAASGTFELHPSHFINHRLVLAGIAASIGTMVRKVRGHINSGVSIMNLHVYGKHSDPVWQGSAQAEKEARGVPGGVC